jgi:hypothetical protein
VAPENEDDQDSAVTNAGSREFWLAVGAKIIENRVTRQDTAADKLVSAVAWFWTAYTASALVGIGLADRSLTWWRLLLAALPSIILIAAYMTATRALMPVDVQFDPRLPVDIERADNDVARKKNRRLSRAKWLTWAGAVSVAVAIVVVATAPASDADAFTASFEGQSTGPGKILFSGRIHDEKDLPVTVELSPHKDATASAQKLQPLMVTTSASGDFNGLFQNVAPATYDVRASWKVDNQARMVSVTVKPESTES